MVRRLTSRTRQIVLGLGGLFGLMIAAWLLSPVSPVVPFAARPSGGYEESLRRIGALRAQDTADVSEACHALVMTHGQATQRAVVMYHGYTNCPRQYEKLARKFFEHGYNVYVPRIPYHGYRNLMTREIGRLTATDLAHVCSESVDIARGLGRRVTVLGLSMGGVMAAWDAQTREDVETAVVIVPSFAWYYLPRVIRPLIHVAALFPNQFLWWDPVAREKRRAPYSMYYRFSSRGMGEILRLSWSVLNRARAQRPGAKHVIVMTNERDNAVDEWTTQTLIHRWRRQGAAVRFDRIPRNLGVEHDVIDPLHPYEQTDRIYSRILELIKAQEDERRIAF